MSLGKNIFNNGVAALLSQVLRALEQLLLIPFFISAWGTEYYGEWITFTIIPNVIGFSDLGFGTATANSFVLSYASNNYQKAVNINKTGTTIISVMILVGLLISAIVMFSLSAAGTFDNSPINRSDAIISVSILILARLLKFYTHVFTSYYRAARRASLGINLLNVGVFLNLMSGVIALTLGYRVIGFAVSQLLAILAFNIYYGIKGRHVLGVFSKYVGYFEKSEQKSIMSKGIGFLMSPVWQAIYFQGTTFVVRIVLGTEAVAIYSTVRTLTRSINQLFNMVNSTVLPELQFEIGAGNWQKAQTLFRVSVICASIIAIVGVAGLLVLGLPIYEMWTKNQLHIPAFTWNLFIVGILFNALWWNSEMVFAATNKPKVLAIFGVICSTTSVLCSYFLSQRIGLDGIAIGSILMEVLMTVCILPYGCILMHTSIKSIITEGPKELKLILGGIFNRFSPRLK